MARPFSNRRGFTLIELAIVLGVVGVLAAGLWRLMATSNQQTEDQTAAQQQESLIQAVSGFLANPMYGQPWLKGVVTAPGGTQLMLPTSSTNCAGTITDPNNQHLCDFLPTGFYTGTTNPYNQQYKIYVARNDGSSQGSIPQSYSFMIATYNGSAIPDVDGGRISGIIGGDGGFVYSSPTICGFTSPNACGSMGTWTVNTSTSYSYAVAAGHAASRTFTASTSASSSEWLARIPMPGDTTFTYNTMTTNLYMGTTAGGAITNIYLGNGSILGNGTTTSLSNSQIQLTASSTAAPALITLVGDCTLINTVGCIPALSVSGGDIDVTNAGIYATKIYSTSDARMKTDIKPLQGALDSLMKLDPITFSFKNGGSKDIGVTAQNVEKVYPQLVTNNNGVKMVEYNGLIGPLIGAVQELKRENDALRAQIQAEAAREDRLEREIRTRAAP